MASISQDTPYFPRCLSKVWRFKLLTLITNTKHRRHAPSISLLLQDGLSFLSPKKNHYESDLLPDFDKDTCLLLKRKFGHIDKNVPGPINSGTEQQSGSISRRFKVLQAKGCEQLVYESNSQMLRKSHRELNP